MVCALHTSKPICECFMSDYKGIILAGGAGVRLRPMTTAVNKHLLPVYDKPMIYYPLSVMAQANIREVLLISTSNSLDAYRALLGDGNQFGMQLEFAIQDKPNGVAESLLIAKDFIGDKNICLILGDNFFFGPQVQQCLLDAKNDNNGALLFAYPVKDPERFGIVTLDKTGNVLEIVEKPKQPASNNAVTGLYFYDNHALEYATGLSPSKRGELEITDINTRYLQEGNLKVKLLGEDCLWFDMGTYESLLQAGNLVRDIQYLQNIQVGCIEEIALKNGWIDTDCIMQSAAMMANTSYGSYLQNICRIGA